MVLSWGPRFLIMIFICFVYLAIYIYVGHEIKAVDRSLYVDKQNSQRRPSQINDPSPSITWLDHTKTKASYRRNSEPCHCHEQVNITEGVTAERGSSSCRSQSALDLQMVLSSENYRQFQACQNDIKRQVGFLLAYPAVFLIIWIFPLIQECLHYRYDEEDSIVRVFWISATAYWMRPFSGFVNSFVFVFKEANLTSSSFFSVLHRVNEIEQQRHADNQNCDYRQYCGPQKTAVSEAVYISTSIVQAREIF